MRQITKDLNSLKEKDITNILLYCLFLLTNDPDYSAISELAYTVDKDSLYKLCSTFGGVTIKIPTINEYENMIKILMLFQKVGTENKSFVDACSELKINEDDIKTFYSKYEKVAPVIEAYINEE